MLHSLLLKENEVPGQINGNILIDIARGAIGEAFGADHLQPPQESWLNQPGATFVTLMEGGELRGCIGTLQAHRPLAEDVHENALAAAFRDPRFQPLAREEFPKIEIEVSLLSTTQPLTFTDEADALAQLRPGIDGVVFEYGRHRSTFLPQVWESFSQPREFLAMLKRKAGLPEDFWEEGVKLSRYTVTKWIENKNST